MMATPAGRPPVKIIDIARRVHVSGSESFKSENIIGRAVTARLYARETGYRC
jgi:hypothetical protein